MNILTFENSKTLINSVTVGKSYMKKIIDSYVVNNNEDIYRELDNMILTIGSRENVDYFYLHDDIRKLFNNEDTFKELSEVLNRHLVLYDDFGYCFMYHAKHVIKEFDERTNGILKPKSVIHNYFKLQPKQPETYYNISDTNTKYNSIMSKMYLEKYNSYVDETDNGAGAWTFQLSATYLIIIDKLYRLLQAHITDVQKFFFDCVTMLNPIISGFTYKTEITSNMYALEIIHELMQLTSTGSFLTIKKNKDKSEVEFIFTTEKGTFSNYEKNYNCPMYRQDKYGKRLVSVRISGSEKRLLLKVDIVGLQSIQDITEQACNPSLFSLNTDENYIEVMSYKILAIILSHTKEFQNDLAQCNKKARKLVDSGKITGLGSKTSLKGCVAEDLLRQTVFMSLEHERLLRPLMCLKEQIPLERGAVNYYRYVICGVNMADSEISQILKPLGSKQQATIRKMINTVKHFNYQGTPALHYLYRELTYRIY